MPGDRSPSEQWSRRVRAARASATAADGLVRVEVDATGEILGIELDPKAMRLPSTDLAAAIRAAGNDARQDARTQLDAAPPLVAPDRGELERLLGDVTVAAQSRLDEFAQYARSVTDSVTETERS